MKFKIEFRTGGNIACYIKEDSLKERSRKILSGESFDDEDGLGFWVVNDLFRMSKSVEERLQRIKS
jgi:hypothetical protein